MEPAASSAINTPARERYDETHGRKGPVATVAVAVAVASLESPFEDSSTFAHAQRFMAKVLAWCLAMEKKAEAASTFEDVNNENGVGLWKIVVVLVKLIVVGDGNGGVSSVMLFWYW
ncbi:hypothetical protein HZH68_004291 [Vespula germanica]|uniref:Uncharacterized protein n=1 Tax=Vespula germanica TaxID=30212 RepID=A0A834NI49_VESGE|nr:hypothetical protein HZH68_004291 [Vespula germanica]